MSTVDTLAKDFLSQKRIAVAGVSRSGEDAANLIYRRLKSTGHQVFPVNPNTEAFEGDPCYPDLKSIPGGVDGVVIVTRPEVTDQIVRQCIEVGVSKVWMHQSMMMAGTSVSEKAVAYCHENDISVIAGACPLMFGETADFGHKCMKFVLRVAGRMPK
ncbi:MAG TPA: CoA-binding protein [Anaerolineales bacterium]|nr:CoA-binding protein [Anaerolineales bacterium]